MNSGCIKSENQRGIQIIIPNNAKLTLFLIPELLQYVLYLPNYSMYSVYGCHFSFSITILKRMVEHFLEIQ